MNRLVIGVTALLFIGLGYVAYRWEMEARDAAEAEMEARDAAEAAKNFAYGAGIAQGCRWGDPASLRCAAYLRGWGD